MKLDSTLTLKLSFCIVGALLVFPAGVNCKTSREYIQDLMSKDSLIIEQAMEYLYETADDTSIVPTLILALDDTNVAIRSNAALILAKRQIGDAIPKIIMLLKDSSEQVRKCAAEAFVYLPNSQAVPFLLETLNDNSEWVRAASAHALGRIKNKKVLPALIESLKDSSWVVRRAVIWALKNVGDETIIPKLKDILENDPYFEEIDASLRGGVKGEKITIYPVREAAAEAIKKLEEAKNKEEEEIKKDDK